MNKRPRNPTNIRGGPIGSRPISSERPRRDANADGRSNSTKSNHSNPGSSQSSDSDRRKTPEPQAADVNDQAGHSRDATARATTFEPLNRSLETFLNELRNGQKAKPADTAEKKFETLI